MIRRTTSRNHGLGWRPDSPDFRDHTLRLDTGVAALPAKFSLRGSPFMPPVYDQGPIGSCTAQAAARCMQFLRRAEGELPDFVPSRLLIYFDVRAAEGSIPYDAGAELRDVFKTLAYYGACDEHEWPYDPVPADPVTGLFPAGCEAVTHPPRQVYVDARKHVPLEYLRVAQNSAQIKAAVQKGYPVTFGFMVYSSIYDAAGEPVIDLPLPTRADNLEGGHAVVIVGWDDARLMPNGLKGAFEVANSWGDQVQDGGYFHMPYQYVTNAQLASDFWIIRRMSG